MVLRLICGQIVVVLLLVSANAADDLAVDLSSTSTMQSTAVSLEFTVGGDLKFQDGETVDKVPVSVVAAISYEERPLPTTEQGPRALARYYEEAKATIKVDEGGANVILPENRKLIVATSEPTKSLLVSPNGSLTREELDLIDVPAGTHLLDRLLPGVAKQVGDSFQHDAETMRLLLGLDEITVCEVASVLIGVERGYAKLRLAGAVHGLTDGASTELDVKAGYLFDTRLGRITRMNLAFAEKRERGPVGPEVDVVGKLSLAIDGQAKLLQLTEERMELLGPRVSDFAQQLLVESKSMGLRFLHDRNWHVTSEERERLVLRRVDGGEFLGQCNVVVQPERKEGRQPTLADFEKDVRFSLGKRFESLVSSGEWTNPAGLRCYRIVAQGVVDDLPMEWRYYLAAPAAGRSVVFSVSVEPRFTERLGDAEKQLVESLELFSQGAEGAPRDEQPVASAVDGVTRSQSVR